MHYGSSKKLSRRGPYPTVVHTKTAPVDLRMPINFPHRTVTVVDLGIPFSRWGPYPTVMHTSTASVHPLIRDTAP